MTKQDILNNTGLSEEEFYQRYPDQETFCSEYPDMCPDMMENDEEEDISNYQNLGYDEDEISMAAYGGSLYEAQDGVQQPAPYTDYNQYQKAMQNYGAEASKASAYNNFQNDLYNQSGTSRGSSETPRQMRDMFNTLSPEQQDAMAAKYNAEFVPAGTPSANRRNYINSMEMNVPGKGTGYYSFPTNDVVYGNKQLERPKYDFPAMTAPQYKMSDTPPAKIQGKPINYKPGTANINFGNTTPTQIINNIGAGYKDPASLNASNGNLPIPKYSMANTMEKVGATNKPLVTSTPNYTSIVDLLKARKQDSSFSNRKKLAEEAGIKNYTGSASQNMDFINRINGIKSSGTEMELGGVNIHPAMRTNFKQGGLVQYKNKGEVKQKPPKIYTDRKMYEQDKGLKMSYGDLLQYVEEPEMIQVDGMRPQYEPEYNTIFYNDPRSIPDELSHAVQRGNRDIGYSVPPNYNSMMRFPPEMKNVYPINRKNIDPALVNANAGEYNAIREKNSPNNSGNSLSNTYQNMYVNRYPADYKMAGEEFLRKLNDHNIYMTPGSGEFEAHQLIEPSLREHYFNYNQPQYKQGGYYGMDGRLHKAKGSGTYVMNGGYYFQPGGTSTASPVASPDTAPGAVGDPAAVPPSSLIDKNMPNADGTFNIDPNEQYNFEDTPEDSTGDFGSNGMGNARQQRRNARRNAPYEMNDLGGLDPAYEQQDEQPIIQSYDPSEYSSAIDPTTGFTKWSKGNQQLTNIKKQDPALWGQLKEEGKGARFRTGQTDVQKVGRAAGKIGATGEALINVAGAFGSFFNNRNEQKNLNASAINKGSTASMYTNPQGAGKGDYGQTGSSYGMTDPSSVGARSFKGMYGKYGMEVPMYDIGGFVPQISTLSDVGLESMKPESINVTSDYLPSFTPSNFVTTPKPVVDNTAVYRTNQPADNASSNMPTGTLDPDFALQSMAAIESGSKPGQTKLGMPTSLVGKDGKKASASGTFQITNDTLQDIYNNDKDISSKYGSFGKFKSAFDVDAKVEYQAAKSLMARHIKKYGIYALGAWYYPEFARKAAAGDKSVFDIIPREDFGNRVKWGDDFNKKLNAYNKLAGTNYNLNTTFNAPKPVAQKKYTTPAGENPMARKTFKDFQTEFSGITNMGIWGDKRHREENPSSDHNTADALDIGIKNIDQGNLVTQKLIKEAKDRNIKYIIFNSRIWDAKTNAWSAYTGKNPHKTHVHTSFNRVKKQFGGQVMEMDEDEIKQFLKAGGQLEFLD